MLPTSGTDTRMVPQAWTSTNISVPKVDSTTADPAFADFRWVAAAMTGNPIGQFINAPSQNAPFFIKVRLNDRCDSDVRMTMRASTDETKCIFMTAWIGIWAYSR